ncbi:MAG: hypothetical protein ABI832_15325 [bacterium]
MKKERRWLKTAIATSAEPQPSLPWQRQTRSRPAAMKSVVPAKASAIAAR